MSQPPSNQYTPPPTFPGQPSAGLYPPGPSKTSGMAIASLVCGILGCIPILPGLLAVLFGFIGIRATSKPGVTGRGLAIAGLILGLLGLIGWTAGGGLFAWGYVKSGPDRAVAKAFVTDLSSGNIAAAQGLCAPGTDPAQLQATSDQIQAWGTLQSFTPIGFGVQASTGSGTATQITGPAIFSKTTKTAFIGLGRDAAGKPIIGKLAVSVSGPCRFKMPISTSHFFEPNSRILWRRESHFFPAPFSGTVPEELAREREILNCASVHGRCFHSDAGIPGEIRPIARFRVRPKRHKSVCVAPIGR